MTPPTAPQFYSLGTRIVLLLQIHAGICIFTPLEFGFQATLRTWVSWEPCLSPAVEISRSLRIPGHLPALNMLALLGSEVLLAGCPEVIPILARQGACAAKR